jgi:hypothetical protein
MKVAELIHSFTTIVIFTKENSLDELQEVFDSLKPEQKEQILDFFKDFITLCVNRMSPEDQETFDRGLLDHISHRNKILN